MAAWRCTAMPLYPGCRSTRVREGDEVPPFHDLIAAVDQFGGRNPRGSSASACHGVLAETPWPGGLRTNLAFRRILGHLASAAELTPGFIARHRRLARAAGVFSGKPPPKFGCGANWATVMTTTRIRRGAGNDGWKRSVWRVDLMLAPPRRTLPRPACATPALRACYRQFDDDLVSCGRSGSPRRRRGARPRTPVVP